MAIKRFTLEGNEIEVQRATESDTALHSTTAEVAEFAKDVEAGSDLENLIKSKADQTAVDEINDLIPNEAGPTNQLADKEYVDQHSGDSYFEKVATDIIQADYYVKSTKDFQVEIPSKDRHQDRAAIAATIDDVTDVSYYWFVQDIQKLYIFDAKRGEKIELPTTVLDHDPDISEMDFDMYYFFDSGDINMFWVTQGVGVFKSLLQLPEVAFLDEEHPEARTAKSVLYRIGDYEEYIQLPQGGSGGSANWGDIGGDINNQSDLITKFAEYQLAFNMNLEADAKAITFYNPDDQHQSIRVDYSFLSNLPGGYIAGHGIDIYNGVITAIGVEYSDIAGQPKDTSLKFVKCSQNEYDNLGVKDENTLYIIVE